MAAARTQVVAPELLFELLHRGNVYAHLHGGDDFALGIGDRRSLDNPVNPITLFVEPGLLAPMGSAVCEGLFHGADGAFLRRIPRCFPYR